MMDEKVYLKFLEILTLIQETSCSNDKRKECTLWVNEFIERADCIEYLYFILTSENQVLSAHSMMIQFLCLKILEDWILFRWNHIDREEKLSIHSGVMKLLDNQSIIEVYPAAQNKLAKIIGEIAKRDFPQEWPTFLEEIIQHWSQDTLSKSKICLMVIQFISEDAIDPDFNSSLPSKRKDEIISGLQNFLPSLLAFCYEWFCRIVNWQQETSLNSGHSTAQITNDSPLSLFSPALQMLTSLVLIAKADKLCEVSHDFSNIAVYLLTTPYFHETEVQVSAVEFLHRLCAKRVSSTLFWSMIAALPPTVTQIPPPDDDTITTTESLHFYTHLGESLSNLLSLHLDIIVETLKSIEEFDIFMTQQQPTQSQFEKYEKDTQLIFTLQPFVGICALISAHPSRRLASIMIRDWLKVVRETQLQKLDWFEGLSAHLLEVYLPKSTKARWKPVVNASFSPEAYDDMVNAEFADYDEYIEFHGQIRSQYNALCNSVAAASPNAASLFLLKKTQELVEREKTLMLNVPSKESMSLEPLRSNLEDCVLQWEAHVSVLDNIFKGVPSSYLASEDSSPLLSTSEMILSWIPTDSSFLLNCVRCIQSLIPLLRHQSNHLQEAFSRLFSAMSCESGSFADPPDFIEGTIDSQGKILLSDFAIQVRRRAGSAISVISYETAEMILSAGLLPVLCTTVNGLLAEGHLAQSQSCSMLEALVSVSEKLPNMSERRSFLHNILGDIISSIQSKEIQDMIATPQLLLQAACGEYMQAKNQSLLGKTINSFTTMMNISRRSPYVVLPDEVWMGRQLFSIEDLGSLTPFIDVWIAVIPSVLRGVDSLHRIWSSTMRNDLITSQNSQSIIYLEPNFEILGLVGNKNGLNIPRNQCPSHTSRIGLNDFRLILYQLIGQACLHKVIYVEDSDFLSLLMSSFLNTIHEMENRHLTQAFRYIFEPLLVNCPPGSGPKIAHFLGLVLTRVSERLVTIWSDHSNNSSVVQWMPSHRWNENEMSFYQYVYYQCSLSREENLTDLQLSNESKLLLLESAREKILFDFTKSIADFIGTACLSRGYLAPTVAPDPNKKSSKDKESHQQQQQQQHSEQDGEMNHPNEKQAQLPLRRQALQHIVFSSDDGTAISELSEPLLTCILLLYQIPHSILCQRAVTVAHYILGILIDENRSYMLDMMLEIFHLGLVIAVKQEKWVNENLLWDLIGLLEEIYSAFVLGIHPQQLQVTSTLTTNPTVSFHSDAPRQLLLSPMVGVPVEILQAMESQLIEAKGKKRRRDLFKDLVKQIIATVKSSTQEDSLTKIIDLQNDGQGKGMRMYRKQQNKSSSNPLESNQGGGGVLHGLFS